MCEIQVALNDTALFSWWVSSIRQVSHNIFLHVLGCNTILMNIPQKENVVESRKCNTTTKIPRLHQKQPLETALLASVCTQSKT